MPFIIGIAAAAAAYHLTNLKNNKCENDEIKEDVPPQSQFDKFLLKELKPITLLPMEQSMLMLENPIQTISFYDGNPSDAARILWDRLIEIARVNPWLSGWLVKEEENNDEPAFEKRHDKIRLWYDESGSSIHPGLFQYFPKGLIHISRETPYTDYEELMDKFHVTVKSNHEIINNVNESIFRVSIIPEHRENNNNHSDSTGFALVVSISHMVGDGYTFYKLYNMLLGASSIEALDPRRKRDFDLEVEELMGAREANYVSHITTDPSWEKFFWWGSEDANENAELSGRLFELNDDWVNDVKTCKFQQERRMNTGKSLSSNEFCSSTSDLVIYNEENNVVKTLSTNDIITSWFWRTIKPSVGMMAVNLRGRVDSASANMAGNYHNSIAYTPADYASPELIQRSLKRCRRAGVDFDPPTILPRARLSTSFSVVTNWTSFQKCIAKSVDEEGLCGDDFNLVRHMPLFYPLKLKQVLPKRTSFLVMFSSGNDKIGCFLVAPSDSMEKIDSSGIMNKIFSQF